MKADVSKGDRTVAGQQGTRFLLHAVWVLPHPESCQRRLEAVGRLKPSCEVLLRVPVLPFCRLPSPGGRSGQLWVQGPVFFIAFNKYQWRSYHTPHPRVDGHTV